MGFNKTWDSNWFINSYTKLTPLSNFTDVKKKYLNNKSNNSLCSNYSFFLHQDFLIRHYLNLIYSNISNNTQDTLTSSFNKYNSKKDDTFFTKYNQTFSIKSWTPWTHLIRYNLYPESYKNLNSYLKKKLISKNSSFFFFLNSLNYSSSLDKKDSKSVSVINKKKNYFSSSILSNYQKLYISFLLNKQKYNIKLILSILNNIYEIRKRLYFLNKSLIFFSFLNQNSINNLTYFHKNNIQNKNKQEDILISPSSSFKLRETKYEFNFIQNNFKKYNNKKRFTRNVCLKLNSKDTKFLFLKQSSEYQNINLKKPNKNIVNLDLKKNNTFLGEKSKNNQFIGILYFKSILKYIIKSLEKSYWAKHKLNINWILYNKNIYYLKTKIYQINKINHSFTLSDSSFKIRTNTTKIGEFDNISILGNLLKTLSITEPNLSNDINLFKMKHINISFYYLHLIYIKLFMINLWKYFLSLRHFKIHKSYNKLILNEIIKPLILQLYLRFDRFSLLPLTSVESNKIIHKNINKKISFDIIGLAFASLLNEAKINSLNFNPQILKNLLSPLSHNNKESQIIKKGDLYSLLFQNLWENIYILKNISSNIFLKINYIPFNNNFIDTYLKQNKILSEASIRNKIKIEDSTLSYFFKTLNKNNINNTYEIFDTLFQRNSFYLSKIKDLSNPSLYFDIFSQINNITNNLDKKNSKNIDKKTLPSSVGQTTNQIQNSKKLSTVEIDGPRIRIKKAADGTQNKTQIEWSISLGLSKNEVNQYKTLLNQSLSLKDESEYFSNSFKLEKFKFSPNISFMEEDNTLEAKSKEPLFNVHKKNNINLNLINIENQSKNKNKKQSFFSLNLKKLQNKLIHNFDINFNLKNNRNTNIKLLNTDLNLLCFQNSFDGPLMYIVPSLKNNYLENTLPFNKKRPFYHGKPFKLINLKNKTHNLFFKPIYNLKNNIENINKNSILLSTKSESKSELKIESFFYKSFFNIIAFNNSIYSFNNSLNNWSNFPLNQKIKDKNNNLKFLPLPKEPKNEFYYQFLRKYAENNNNVDINIKHYYSKTCNAYTLIENLSRFLIAFIKKNKGGKNKFQQLKNITYKVLQFLIQNQFDGVAFYFSGRVYGAKKGMSFKMLFGSVPFNTLKQNIDYAQLMQKTRNGTWGFQIWLNFKKKQPRLMLPIKSLTPFSTLKKKRFFLTPFVNNFNVGSGSGSSSGYSSFKI